MPSPMGHGISPTGRITKNPFDLPEEGAPDSPRSRTRNNMVRPLREPQSPAEADPDVLASVRKIARQATTEEDVQRHYVPAPIAPSVHEYFETLAQQRRQHAGSLSATELKRLAKYHTIQKQTWFYARWLAKVELQERRFALGCSPKRTLPKQPRRDPLGSWRIYARQRELQLR